MVSVVGAAILTWVTRGKEQRTVVKHEVSCCGCTMALAATMSLGLVVGVAVVVH